MAEWLYEAGVGENRAALVEDHAILAAAIERPGAGARLGAVIPARYAAALSGNRSALVTLADGTQAYLEPVPRGFGPGASASVEVMREAIVVPGRRAKAARVRVIPDAIPPRPGPALRERIAADGHPVHELRPHEPDALEAAGWSELLEEALTGRAAFPGGTLLIEQTEGMVVIDVDGTLDPAPLAVAAAGAAARAIRQLGLGGSIGIDFPSTADRDARKAIADAFDAAMHGAFERTAVNGWGFMQVVLPRPRPSLPELLRSDQSLAAALALYRRAEREPVPGPIRLSGHPAVVAVANTALDAELAARRGGAVEWTADVALPLWGGHVQPLRGLGPGGTR